MQFWQFFATTTGTASATDVTGTTAPVGDATVTATGWEWLLNGEVMSIVMIVAMIAIMYFVMIRPQRKRQKEEQQMRNALRVGDEITTIGGICGRVLQVKEDSLVIETGADRSKMTIKKWAIQSCDTVHDAADVDDDDDDED